MRASRIVEEHDHVARAAEAAAMDESTPTLADAESSMRTSEVTYGQAKELGREHLKEAQGCPTEVRRDYDLFRTVALRE